jgi:hypothetical protein
MCEGSDSMKTAVWFLIAALFSLFIAGCYTMLSHPRTEATPEPTQPRRHCSDCHGSADYYYWHYPNYFNWYWDYPSWRSYYYDPWWWYDYWYWYDDGGVPVQKGERHLWQRVERPKEEAEFVPGMPDTKSKTERAPTADTPEIGGDKEKTTRTQESSRHLWRPVRRPPKPKEESDTEPKAKKEKAEDKK